MKPKKLTNSKKKTVETESLDSIEESAAPREAEPKEPDFKSLSPAGPEKRARDNYRHILGYTESLKNMITELIEANQELEIAFLDTIQRLVLIAELKDNSAEGHIMRISRYSAMLARKLGFSERDVQDIALAAPMHDVGNIYIPDSILLKPGRLSEVEQEEMKKHTLFGSEILKGSQSRILKMAEQIALTHHERWDGRGYPQKLAKSDIPIVGRIVGLVDVFDALTSKRPFKDPYPENVAKEIIQVDAGHHFDPHIAKTFLDHFDEIVPAQEDGLIDFRRGAAEFNWSERDADRPSKPVKEEDTD